MENKPFGFWERLILMISVAGIFMIFMACYSLITQNDDDKTEYNVQMAEPINPNI